MSPVRTLKLYISRSRIIHRPVVTITSSSLSSQFWFRIPMSPWSTQSSFADEDVPQDPSTFSVPTITTTQVGKRFSSILSSRSSRLCLVLYLIWFKGAVTCNLLRVFSLLIWSVKVYYFQKFDIGGVFRFTSLLFNTQHPLSDPPLFCIPWNCVSFGLYFPKLFVLYATYTENPKSLICMSASWS